MNRRKFLQGVAAVAAAAVLPKVDMPEPSGFDKLIAECPTRPMTYADLEKGVEMLRKGWPDPVPWWDAGVPTPVWAAQFDPPLEVGNGSLMIRDNFGISAKEIRAAVERCVKDALRDDA